MATPSSKATTPNPALPIEELARLPGYYALKLSHDRSKLAYYADHSGRIELYVMDVDQPDSAKQVSHGEVPKAIRATFIWMRDGEHIIFPKDNDGDEQHNLWRINIHTGQAEQLTDNAGAQEYPIEVHPDGKTLLVSSTLNGQMNIYTFDLETRQYTQLTHFNKPAYATCWNTDGSQITFASNDTKTNANRDVYIMNADGSDLRRVVHLSEGSKDTVNDWSKDGRYLAITSDHFGGHRAGLYDIENDNIRWLTEETGEAEASSFSPDGSRLFVQRNSHAQLMTQVFDVASGDEIAVDLPPGLATGAMWLDDNRFIYYATTDRTRTDICVYDLASGTNTVLLPAEYGSINPDVFVNAEYISYRSFDGREIPAILYRPHNAQAGQTFPAIINVHGGPSAQFFRGFHDQSQVLANNGFVVLQPNPRGSTGYGVEFRDIAKMDWGGGDLEDIAYGAEFLKSLPEVEADRIGITGGSYGGYMTFIAMTKKPDLFKAGLAWVGITDLRKLHDNGMPHFQAYLQELMGDPDENADLWRDRSALYFAEQMTGHIYIGHGVNDPRCPIEQARLFRDRLLELGKVEGEDFEYLEIDDQGHGSQDIEAKIHKFNLVLDYFTRKL